MEAAVLIPIKSFGAAKRRLAAVMSAADRQRLAEWMASRVLAAASPLPVFVACDDELVAEWAESHGAIVLWGPGVGLNRAIDQGIDTMRGKGIDRVVIAHGDLPLATHLARLVHIDGFVIVPDQRRDGTNVLCRPTSVAFPAQYGGGSFGRHLTAAIATGTPVTVRRDVELAIDVDTIADCRHPLVAPLLAELGVSISSDER